jgi:zinc protease
MVRAALVFRGGSADVSGLPPISARLLAETLFGELRAEDLGERRELDQLLNQAEQLREGLRLERLRGARTGDASPEEASLAASLKDLETRISVLSTPPGHADLLDALGAVNREVRTGADGILAAQDLPSSALEPWAKLEAQRLHALRLARFTAHQEALGRNPEEPPLSLLLAAALPGHPYAQSLSPAGLAALQREDLRAWARRALAPDRMAVLLVGDLRLEALLPALEASLGGLEAVAAAHAEGSPEDPLRAPGRRRLEVSTPGPSQLLVGWRVPSVHHPDRLTLEALALALPAPSSVLKEVDIQTQVPGGRFGHLFVVEARAEEGFALGEAEEELKRWVRRVQEEALPPEAFEGLVRRLELASLAEQGDATRLLHGLAQAWGQTGDWRTAFPALRGLRQEGPAALQQAAKFYLADGNATVLLLQPDLSRYLEERGESELLRLLRTRALRKVADPIKAEALAQQSMEQLLLLTREQREQLRRLLEGSIR